MKEREEIISRLRTKEKYSVLGYKRSNCSSIMHSIEVNFQSDKAI